MSQETADHGRRPPGRLARLKPWTPTFVAAAVLLASVALRTSDLPGFTVCWFKAATGWPCPGCGLTRAFCSISHGDFAAAWRYNPLSYPVYAGFVIALFWPLLGRWRPVTALTGRPSVSRWVAVSIAVALWGWGIWRIVTL